ncbi:MAG: 5'-3' exonuclease H3TH domain-containing protein, partial [Nannocystaceae bacterium]
MSEQPTGGPGSIFIIDANNYVFRAFHALPMLTAPDGTPINAVHGFVRMLQALRGDFSPERIVAVFDAPGPSFRDELFEQYKANRAPPPEDLRPQFPLVREATKALGIPLLEIGGVEADDVIATLAVRARDEGMRAFILSSDKDLMQLVDDPGPDGRCIRLYDGMKRRLVGPEQVREKYHGVGPERLGDLLALMGDSVDNVPGVPGIGPKTAAALLLEFGQLEDVLTAAPSLKQKRRRERLIEHAEDARLSRVLVELKCDVEVETSLDELRDGGVDHAQVKAFFEPLGFKTTLAGLLKSGKGASRGAGPATSPAGGAALPSVADVKIDGERTRVLGASSSSELATWLKGGMGSPPSAVAVFGSHAEPMRADILGIAIAQGGEVSNAIYLPVGHRNLQDDSTENWSPASLTEHLGPWLREPSISKVLFNAKSQGVLLEEHDLALAGVTMDPMLASYTLDAARGSHELEALALDVLGHALTPEERIVGKGRKQIAYDQVLVAQAGPFAGERALAILELSKAMMT